MCHKDSLKAAVSAHMLRSDQVSKSWATDLSIIAVRPKCDITCRSDVDVFIVVLKSW